jgi:WD40 repeat protein
MKRLAVNFGDDGWCRPRRWLQADETISEESRRLHVSRVLHGHQGCVNSLEWATDGRLLVSGSDDQTIGLWRFPDDTSTASLTQQFSERTASSDLGGSPRCYRMPTCHTNNIFCTSIVPGTGNASIVSCALDGDIVLNNVVQCSGAALKVTNRRRMALTTQFLAGSATTFLCSLSGAGLVLFDIRTMRSEGVIMSVKKEHVFGFSCHPTDTFAAVLGTGMQMYWLDLRGLGTDAAFASMDFTNELVGTGADSSCTVSGFDMRPTSIALSFMQGPVLVLRSSGDAKVLRGPDDVDSAETAVLWDHINNQTFLKQPQLFGANGRFVAHGGDKGVAHVYDCGQTDFREQLLRRVDCDSMVCNVVKVHPSTNESGFPVLAASGIDRTIKLLAPDSGRLVHGDLKYLESEESSSDEQMAIECAGQLEKAKAAANSLLPRRPAYALDLYTRALCRSRLFHGSSACRAVVTAIALNASLAAFRCGAYDVGLRTADYGHRLDPLNAKALYRKAICLRAMRRLEEAQEAATSARKLLPSDAAIQEICQAIQRDIANAEGKLRRACASLFSAQ